MSRPVTPFSGRKPRIQPKWVARQAHFTNIESFCVFEDQPEHDRMQMHVQVAVHMIERQAAGLELLELRQDFRTKLRQQSTSRKVPANQSPPHYSRIHTVD